MPTRSSSPKATRKAPSALHDETKIPTRAFMFLEERVKSGNYMDLVRHTSMRVRFAYSPSCKRCATFKRVLDHFPQIESVSTRSSRYKRHHYMLEVSGEDSDDVYDFPLPNTDHGYKLRNWIVDKFFLKDDFKPREHQAAFAAGFQDRDLPRGIAMIWQVGSGKSHGALHLLKEHDAKHVVIVCNISLIPQWVSSIKQQAGDLHVEIYGFDNFKGVVGALTPKERARFLQGSDAIVDEFHRFKNQRDSMEESIQALLSADTLLFLSGTPAPNDVTDINITLRFLDLEELIPEGSTVQSQGFETAAEVRARSNAYESPELLRSILRACADGRVSVYNPRFSMSPALFRSHFPTTHEGPPVYHEMNYYQVLSLMFNGSGTMVPIKGKNYPIGKRGGAWTRLPFMAGVKDVFTGELRSSKPGAILSEVRSIQKIRPPEYQFPFVIYSRFKTDLLIPIFKVLQEWLIGEGRDPSGVQLLTGDTPVKMRPQIIDRYNRGELDFLLICRVGNEGLDLKWPAAGMFMLEPQNTEDEEKQVFGRVVRLHTKRLPKGTPPIEKRRFIARYPTRAPTAEEGQYIMDYVFNDPRLMRAFKFDKSDQVDGDEVLEWIYDRMEQTGGITEEEHIYQANKEKSKRVEPIMAVLWGASALFASGGAKANSKKNKKKTPNTGDDPDIADGMPREWKIKLQRALHVKTDVVREEEQKADVLKAKKEKIQAKEKEKIQRKLEREKVRKKVRDEKATAKAAAKAAKVKAKAEAKAKGKKIKAVKVKKTKAVKVKKTKTPKSKVEETKTAERQIGTKKRPRETSKTSETSETSAIETRPTKRSKKEVAAEKAAKEKKNARRRELYRLRKQNSNVNAEE